MVTACISSVLLPLLGSFKGKEAELKSQYDMLCADIDTPSMNRDAMELSRIWYTAGGAAAGVACAVGVWKLSSAQGLFGVKWGGVYASGGARIEYVRPGTSDMLFISKNAKLIKETKEGMLMYRVPKGP